MIREAQFEIVPEPGDALQDVIRNVLEANNNTRGIPPYDKVLFTVTVKQGGDIVGGLTGYSVWDWLYIDTLAVREDYRGRDYGLRLLSMAEEEARKRGCVGVHLSTMSFQAEGFYKKAGYEEYGCLDPMPAGHRKILYRKFLTGSVG